MLHSSFCAANPCRVRSYTAVQAYVVPIVYPKVYYRVGAQLRQQSAETAYIRSQDDYQEFLQFQAFKAGIAAAQQQQQLQKPQNSVQATCARCHARQEPPNGFFLDGGPMTPETAIKSLRKIAAGEMPKDEEISNELKAQLMHDLLDLSQVQEQPKESNHVPNHESVPPPPPAMDNGDLE